MLGLTPQGLVVGDSPKQGGGAPSEDETLIDAAGKAVETECGEGSAFKTKAGHLQLPSGARLSLKSSDTAVDSLVKEKFRKLRRADSAGTCPRVANCGLRHETFPPDLGGCGLWSHSFLSSTSRLARRRVASAAACLLAQMPPGHCSLVTAELACSSDTTSLHCNSPPTAWCWVAARCT